jgi:hypothetical protein
VGRKKKDDGVEKGEGRNSDDNNGDSKIGRKGGCLPFFGCFNKGKRDNYAEKGLADSNSATTIAGPAYDQESTAVTPPVIQAKVPTGTDRWSNVDSVMTWEAKDRAAMHWAKVKGQFLSVFRKFGKKS